MSYQHLLVTLLTTALLAVDRGVQGFTVLKPHSSIGSAVATPASTAAASGARCRYSCVHAASADDPSNRNNNVEPEKEKGILDFIFNPYESKIPKEIEKDIFAAEANTPAAKERGQRIGLYAAVAFTGVLFAFFNGFITELRSGPTPDGNPVDLDGAGFGWVYSNFLLEFLFTNKIGGLICLIGGGACGLLAEAEFDTRRINAEKIFDEMQRRRADKEGGGIRRTGGTSKKAKDQEKKRPKRRSGKESKRMGALSEVVLMAGDSTADPIAAVAPSEPATLLSSEQIAASTEAITSESIKSVQNEPVVTSAKEDGILGKIKGFYDKADAMAATLALLLNKKLEDEGLTEKITDETGFKVIGKEAAAQIKKENQEKQQ